MKLSRRGFLGAAAASPLAAKDMVKKVTEQAQMEAAGISYYGDSMYSGITGTDIEPPMRSIWDAMAQIGIPEWKKIDLREDARRSRTLDPDIASMRSLSLSAKMRKQWDRNYDQLIERAMKQSNLERMKKVFFETNPDISEW